MRITDSAIVMNSQYSSLTYHETKETLNMWVDPQTTGAKSDRIQLSAQSQGLMEGLQNASDTQAETTDTSLEASLKKLIVELISGRRIKTLDSSELQGNPHHTDLKQAGGHNSSESERVGWGLEYTRQETHVEQEQMSFNAAGVIRTADNKEITFNLNLSMSREYISQTTLEVRAGDALIDPLVINYAGAAAQLSGKTFSFDLNADGVADDMPELAIGSGYLAFDQDGDGAITSGQELFGPSSGNGFSELAAYDSDGNQWIDEADPVFSQLSVMTVQNGQATLSSLSELGIGAIYLGSVNSPFELRDSSNDLQAQIASTGIFLREDGTAGTIQHLDVVV